MRQRPLPKIVAPVDDELLSGWLTRLAAVNSCDLADLLAHVGIRGRYAFLLDFGLEADAARTLAAVSRTDPERVQSLTFPATTPLEASLTAKVPFQACPDCSRSGLALKHWRLAWTLDCGTCGARLAPILARPGARLPADKLLRRARIGADLLGKMVKENDTRQGRRVFRGVGFAMALKGWGGPAVAALHSFDSDIRFACQAAISAAQQRPVLKAAWIDANADDLAKLRLLKKYHKEPHLVATVGRIRVPPRRVLDSGSSMELDIIGSKPAPKPRKSDPALIRDAVEIALAGRGRNESIPSVYRRADRLFQTLRAEAGVETVEWSGRKSRI